MPVSFNNLPLEIQRQILSHLYQPWHLETKNVPAFNRVPIYTFAASVRIDSGPILACRSMHDVAVDLLEEKFTGLLDASTTRHDEQHSIMPKYKPFLHKIFTLVLGSLGSLATMGTIYCQRLPSLDIIEIIPKEKIFLALSVDLQSILLNHILHTTSHDEAMVTSMAAFWHYWLHFNEFIRTRRGVQIILRQTFDILGVNGEVITTFDLSSKPPIILSKRLALGCNTRSSTSPDTR